MPKKRLREYETSDATNISLRHKNSPFSDSTSAALFADKVLLKTLWRSNIRVSSADANSYADVLSPLDTQFIVSKVKNIPWAKEQNKKASQAQRNVTRRFQPSLRLLTGEFVYIVFTAVCVSHATSIEISTT